MKKNNRKHKALALLAIIGLVLSPVITMARALPPASSPTEAVDEGPSILVGGPTQAPELPPGAIDPSSYLRPPTSSANVRASTDTLNKWRAVDQQQCELEAKGKNRNPTIGQAIVGRAITPLKNVIDEQIGLSVLPEAVNFTNPEVTQATSRAIEEELKTSIHDQVATGLREELPRTIAARLAEEQKLGHDAEYFRNNRTEFRGLIDASIREAWPRILNHDIVEQNLAGATSRGLQRSLHDTLQTNFRRTAQPTIEDHYRAQISSMIETIPDMVKNEVENIQGTIEGTKQALDGAITGFVACAKDIFCIGSRLLAASLTADLTFTPSAPDSSFADDPSQEQEGYNTFLNNLPLDKFNRFLNTLFPEIKQIKSVIQYSLAQLDASFAFLDWVTKVKPNDLLKDMLAGFSAQLERTLTEPKNLNRLSVAITNAISDPINRSIEDAVGQVSASLSAPIDDVISSINLADENFLNPILDAVDLQLNTAINQITSPITAMIDQIGDNVAGVIDETVGATLYPLAQGITDTSFEFGSAIADGINTVGFSIQDQIFPQPQVTVLPDDFRGAVGPGEMLQKDFTFAQNNGFLVVSDNIGRELRRGEIRYSDYASLTDSSPLLEVNGISQAAAESTEGATEQIVNNALDNQSPDPENIQVTGDLTDAQRSDLLSSNMFQNLKAGVGNIFATSIGSMFAGVPYVGSLLQPVVEKTIQAAAAAIGLGSSAAGAAGQVVGVPTAEVDGLLTTAGSLLVTTQGISKTSGDILGTEKQTRDMTEKLLFLQIQTCTNLKVLQRVQLRAEENMFAWGPNERKAAAQAIDQHKNDVINKLLNQGYAVSENEIGVTGENPQPLYVQNQAEHLGDVRDEQFRILLDELDNLASINPYAAMVRDRLSSEQNAGAFAAKLTPTLSPDELKKIADGEQITLDTFRKLAEPQNTPAGTDYLARQELAKRQSEAELNEREQLAWGQGILPVRECTEEDDNGECLYWETKTPAPFTRDYVVALLTSTLRQLEQADSVGESFLKRDLGLALEQLAGLDDYKDSLKQSTFRGPDPCPGPEPCPDAGWQQTTNL